MTPTNIDESGQRALQPNECLFDQMVFKDMESNLVYMADKYGFVIPELEYCIDLEGLMRYLGKSELP